MRIRVPVVLFALLIVVAAVEAQMTPWYQWTFLDAEIMDEIVGEVSGETAWNSMLEMGAYNRDRRAPEYAGTFLLLLVSIALALFGAAKVFRVGILMTGKPPKIREILRWLRAPIGTVRVSDKDR